MQLPLLNHINIFVLYHHKLLLLLVKSQNKDHGKENHKKIKEIQRANKERQQVVESSRQTPMKAVYKPDKFDHVQSKVAQRLKVNVCLCSQFEINVVVVIPINTAKLFFYF